MGVFATKENRIGVQTLRAELPAFILKGVNETIIKIRDKRKSRCPLSVRPFLKKIGLNSGIQLFFFFKDAKF